MKIRFAVKTALGSNGQYREINVPTVQEARNKPHSRRDRLDDLIIEHGNYGIEMYCLQCFSWSNLSMLEIHDYAGSVVKFV